MKEDDVIPIKELKTRKASQDINVSKDFTDIMSEFLEK